MSALRSILAGATALFLLAASPAHAKNGAFKSTAHGDANKGPARQRSAARGSCTQCHNGHASHQPGGAGNRQLGLFTSNDNTLCFECHALPSDDGIFGGSSSFMRSTHGTSPQVYGGGDPQRNAEPNRCVNCHDPHGVNDQKGLVPAMLAAREPELCLGCHNGSRAIDIANETTKSFTHGLHARGAHDPHEGGNPQQPAYTPANRHVTCSDCHNVHIAARDRFLPAAPEASARLAGVSRVTVINGPAGSLPSFTFIGAGDVGPANEYEICFKCHSSYAKQPPQQSDLALLTNPENPSFHPIQAAGRNRGIRRDAFAGEYDANSILTCTSCHGSDDTRVAGPHGSRFEFLLKKEAIVTTDRRAMTKDNLCFDCHSFEVYADPSAPETTASASRFNGPAAGGHAFHVGTQQIPCASCHDTHGSTRYPALVATGKAPGIFSYTQTPTGGTCTSSCHPSRTYAINYGR